MGKQKKANSDKGSLSPILLSFDGKRGYNKNSPRDADRKRIKGEMA